MSLLSKLTGRFGGDIISTHDHRGDETAVVKREAIVLASTFLRDEAGCDMLSDMTAVDYLQQGQEPRFEVVYHFHAIKSGERLRLKVQVPEEDPVVPSLHELYRIADWMEREIWDMYGIRFKGHPNLKRILMYEEFVGHPLRKDYPKEKRQPLIRRPENEIAEVLAKRGKARSLPRAGE